MEKEIKIFNFNKSSYCILKLLENKAIEISYNDKIFKYENKHGYNETLLKTLNLNEGYEYKISDVNRLIISLSCEFNIKLDKRDNLVIFNGGSRNFEGLSFALNENLEVYLTEGRRLVYKVDIDLYHKVLNQCINLFGEKLCRESALTYMSNEPIYEREEIVHGEVIVTLTGEYYNGIKHPKEGTLFKNQFIHEQGFKLPKIAEYEINNIPIKELYNIMSELYKDNWGSLYFCMQPDGEWWISNGMLYDGKRWSRYYSDVLFDIFDWCKIKPIDEPSEKFYLSDIANKQNFKIPKAITS